MLCDTTPMRWLHLPRQPKCWQQMPLTNVPLLPWLLEQHKAAGALMALECLPVPSKTALAPRTQLFVSEWQGLSRWHTAACWRLGWGCSRHSPSVQTNCTPSSMHIMGHLWGSTPRTLTVTCKLLKTLKEVPAGLRWSVCPHLKQGTWLCH